MLGKLYRLRIPTLAIMHRDGQHFPVTVPVGGVVHVITRSPNGDRLIDVKWGGKALMMFPIDVLDHGELFDLAVN